MMERCPNCGTPGRPGAKFCTTCGFRFPGDESTIEVVDVSASQTPLSDNGEPGGVAAEPTFGWPSPPSSQEPSPGPSDESSVNSMTDPPASADEPADIETIANSWPDEGLDAWPARPASDAADPVAIEPPSDAGEPEPDTRYETPAADQAGNAESIARAMRLLDELRDTIAGIEASTALDLRGVISELEVAVTPPGAMAADDVAELREALLAARERPRDIDTIVDLTKRIDAMVALVIAYDRTIAAIERSLDALRG
ncbi:MAG: zinc ribbon domain-containing protein [Chloroflexi bacterium]|nr:zinc ribbon domain-containing protein [Chloroflexota bacterium]